jgi:hypothetical protein
MMRKMARANEMVKAIKIDWRTDLEQMQSLVWSIVEAADEGHLPNEKSTLDARNKVTRLRWEGQYELVSRPVRRRNGDLDYAWTWVFQEPFLARWKRAFAKAAGRVRSSRERKPNYLIRLVTSLRNVPGFHGINRQKKALITGANIPRIWHLELNLKCLGTVVNKALPVFNAGRTVLTMSESGHLVRQLNQ